MPIQVLKWMLYVQYIVKNTVKPWSGETGPLIRACSSGKNVFFFYKNTKKHLNALTFTSALRRRVNFRAVPQQGSGCRRPQNRSSGGVRGGGPGHMYTDHVRIYTEAEVLVTNSSRL